MRPLVSERGSVLLETSFTFFALSILLLSGFLILYTAFVRVWLDRQVYEGLVCLASTARERDCERQLRKHVEFALPIGEISNVQLARTQYEASVRLSFEILNQNVLRLEDRRRLPLFSGASK